MIKTFCEAFAQWDGIGQGVFIIIVLLMLGLTGAATYDLIIEIVRIVSA
jgi:hypothetical protein